MNDTCSSDIRSLVSLLALAMACGSLMLACSGQYPLGETSGVAPLLDGDGESGSVNPSPAIDARVPVGLAPPDFSISAVEGSTLDATSVASVGDLDGDGRADMAVAGVDPASGVSYVHLRYGGPRPLGAADVFAFDHSGVYLTLPNEDWAHLTVASAGDVDGDGYADLLIDTPQCDITAPYEGTYLVYGGPERLEGMVPFTSIAARIVPPSRDSHPPPGYGFSCSGVVQPSHPGDLDGDGFDDLVLKRIPQVDTSGGGSLFGTGEGVYVFYGRAQRLSGQVPLSAADASLHITQDVSTYALGDIDGDGRADILVSPDSYRATLPGSYLVKGRAERYSGQLDLAATATLLAGAYATNAPWLQNSGDLDGDGLDDVLLWDIYFSRHLFYGAPGLFSNGLDFSQADADIDDTAGYVFPVGDRDGDGDDEMLDQFSHFEDGKLLESVLTTNVAFASGSRERFSGTLTFPEGEILAQAPDGLFPEQAGTRSGRALTWTIPAGDLDGDGAADLFTTSDIYEIVGESSYNVTYPQVHIHYGTPASLTPSVR
jgi:hypothetical protein